MNSYSKKFLISAGAIMAAWSGIATSADPRLLEATANASGTNQVADTAADGDKIINARQKNTLIEEVVVTAQKREQAIQDVPIAISAFTSEMLDIQSVTTADGLARVTPGMTFTKTGGFSVIYLRGIGTDAFLPGADQTVPQYIDGVNVLGSQGSQYELGNVERIEILKGPQGTLFGRNSTGGAINIVTPDPGQEFYGDAVIEFGQSGTWNSKVFANIPLQEGFAFTVSGFNNSHDEYYSNASGPIVKRPFQRGGSLKTRWDATDDLSLTLFGSTTAAKVSDSLVLENVAPSPILGALITPDKLDRVAHNDILGGSMYQTYLASATLRWTLPWVDLKIIGSNQEFSSSFNQLDFDNSPLPLVSFWVPDQFAKQTTAELQILSNSGTPFGDRFEWVAGLYYLDGLGGFQRITLNVAQDGFLTVLGPTGKTLQSIINSQLVAAGLPGLLTNSLNAYAGGLIKSGSLSGYAQGTFYFNEALNLTLGARYQEETRGVRNSRFGLLNPLSQDEIPLLQFAPPDLRKRQLAPRVALQWKFNDDGQVYTSWSRGFQSPTYNAVNFFTSPDPVREVRIDAYELGIKSKALGGNAQFDSAIFYTREKDATNAFVSLSSGGLVRFDNVGSAEIYGAEFTGTVLPFPEIDPGLAVSGGATYLHAYYLDFIDGRGFDEATGLAFGPGVVTPLPPRDFSGNRIVRTPKVTANIGISQQIEVDSGTVDTGIDFYYNSGFYYLAQNSPQSYQGAYNYLNAHLSYRHDPWNMKVTTYCLNALDSKYVDSMFPTDFGYSKHLSVPRIVGLKAQIDF